MSGNGHGDTSVMDFAPLGSFEGNEVPPEAPDGEWTAAITVERKMSAGRGGKARVPMFHLILKLETAHTEGNEHAEGTELNDWVMFYPSKITPPIKATVRRNAVRKLHNYCEALNIDTGTSGPLPTEMNSWDDFQPLLEAMDGQRLTIWTKAGKNRVSGDDEVRIFTTPPKGFAAVETNEEDEV